MVDLDSQKVCCFLVNILTQFLILTWLIWTLRMYVVCSQIYSLGVSSQHGWFGLLDGVWFSPQITYSISEPNVVDLDSQFVCGLPPSLLTQFLTQHGWFGPSACVWFAHKSTHSISEPNMVNFDSQEVRGLLSNPLTWFLIPKWLIWTPSLCVVCSQACSLNF